MRARKFALPAPLTMQICEGASFPRRMLELPSWTYRPTCSTQWRRPSRRGGPAFYPRSFFLNCSTAFVFPDFAFLLFHFLYFTQLLCFTEMLLAFKMGVKIFRTGTMSMRSQHDALFQIHYDGWVVAETPFSNPPRWCRRCRDARFQFTTIVSSLPRGLLSNLPRSLIFAENTFSNLHNILFFARTSFAWTALTPYSPAKHCHFPGFQ